MNFESDLVTPDAIDLYHLKHVSRQLVQEAEPLRVQLTQPEQQPLRELISDLEVILLQISNLEAKQDLPGIDLVRSSVNRKAILLRINLEEIQQLDAETTSLSNSGKIIL